MNIKISILTIIFLLVSFCSFAQAEKSITFKGIVSDKETNEPLLYASVYPARADIYPCVGH